MDAIRSKILELEFKASEASLIAGLATAPRSRAAYEALAQSLAQLIHELREQNPDRHLLLNQAERCRALARKDGVDTAIQADLRALANDLEAKACS